MPRFINLTANPVTINGVIFDPHPASVHIEREYHIAGNLQGIPIKSPAQSVAEVGGLPWPIKKANLIYLVYADIAIALSHRDDVLVPTTDDDGIVIGFISYGTYRDAHTVATPRTAETPDDLYRGSGNQPPHDRSGARMPLDNIVFGGQGV
jgi:hypothetical protein